VGRQKYSRCRKRRVDRITGFTGLTGNRKVFGRSPEIL
jgi:hypothetical protein